MNDDTDKNGNAAHGSGTGELHPSTGPGEDRLSGSGVRDSRADGGEGAQHDSRLGGGGPVGADIGGQGGSGASGNALPEEGPARGREDDGNG